MTLRASVSFHSKSATTSLSDLCLLFVSCLTHILHEQVKLLNNLGFYQNGKFQFCLLFFSNGYSEFIPMNLSFSSRTSNTSH